ncbi:cobyrinic acid a,c-diamide synthase [Krasilnikovia sp. MM14-A1004]|uniref:nucleotide-binding protein n=1 Tax=Krasilnikovia sp. MM14-A1004 TaxID=3373541 RepID=UPI00399C8C09
MTAQPRLVVSAPSSGHGKTAIAVGLLAAVAARGLPAAGFKVGPDHTDAAYLGLAAGRTGRNLDPRLVGAHLMAPLFAHGAAGAHLAVIEGAMGLFDSLTGQPEIDGTAAVAAALRAPVVLVVDVAAMGNSIAALVHGFRMFDEMVHLGGVILNRVASPRHEQILRTALDDIGMPVLGALRRGDLPAVLPARAHGPVPVVHRSVDAARAVRRLGETVSAALDLDRLLALAGSAPALPGPIWSPGEAVATSVPAWSPGDPAAPWPSADPAAAWSPRDPAAAWSPGDPAAAWSPGDPGAAWSPGEPLAARSPGEPLAAWTPGEPPAGWTPGDRTAARSAGDTLPAWSPGDTVPGWSPGDANPAWSSSELSAPAGVERPPAKDGRPVIALAGGPGAPYTYVENAELLTAAGADVVVFDPLRDEDLPAGVRGLVIGAALPEAFVEELSANRRLCDLVARFAHEGWPVVAEGVGLPWLGRDLDGRPMCGVLDVSAATAEQTVAGYREATAPTASVLAPAGARITGYKQHRAIVTPRAGQAAAWTWAAGNPEGFVWRQVHASQLGLHWAAAPEIARRMVAAARSGPPRTAARSASAHSAPAHTAPAHVGPGQVVPGQVVPGQVVSGQVVSGQVVSGQVVPGHAGPGQVGPRQAGPGQAGAGLAGAGPAGQGHEGPGQAGSAHQVAPGHAAGNAVVPHAAVSQTVVSPGPAGRAMVAPPAAAPDIEGDTVDVTGGSA